MTQMKRITGSECALVGLGLLNEFGEKAGPTHAAQSLTGSGAKNTHLA